MRDLQYFNEKIKAHWWEIVRKSKIDGAKVNEKTIFRVLDLNPESEDGKILQMNLPYLSCLIAEGDGIFSFSPDEEFPDRPKERFDADDDLFMYPKNSATDLLNVEIPFTVAHIHTPIHTSKSIFIMHKEAKVCLNCHVYDKERKFCTFRGFFRIPASPACRYIGKENRRSI